MIGPDFFGGAECDNASRPIKIADIVRA